MSNYTYVEENDATLESFDIARDRQSLLPMIQSVLQIALDMKLFASPWSPPAWIKTSGQMNRGGTLKLKYRQAWADYYVRYIREYEKTGVPMWGLTVQNEPEAIQPWDSCVWTGEDERDFVRDYLGPTLHRAGLQDLKLMIWDHNRDRMFERAKVVYDDAEAAKYVWGLGFHWYVSDHFDNVRVTHDAYPDKHLLFTEGCQEGGPHIGSWATGERYARSIVQDLNNWCEGWVDWNLVLDETGGPNHVNNLCSAPIIADTQNDAILLQSSYFYIGHFCRFIRPGAKRILCASVLDDWKRPLFKIKTAALRSLS